MFRKINLLSFGLLLIVLSLILQNSVLSSEMKYTVAVTDYEFDMVNKKSNYRGRGVIFRSLNEPAHIKIRITSPNNGIGISVGSKGLFYSDLQRKLHNTITEKMQLNQVKFSERHRQVKKSWNILFKPVFDEQNKVINIFLGIERYERIPDSSDNDVFKISSYVLSKKELLESKEFSYTSNNVHLDELVPGDNRLKMLILETPETLKYVTFDVEVYEASSKEEENIFKRYTEIPSIEISQVKVPFDFDIKYENSYEVSKILKKVSQAEQFSLKIYEEDKTNPQTNEKQSVQYFLKGKIFPIQYDKDNLNIRLELSHEKGGEGTSFTAGYTKEITLKSKDVVEVKLPKFGKIEEHSLFLKPVKIKN